MDDRRRMDERGDEGKWMREDGWMRDKSQRIRDDG